jgi:hypothetical protein
MTMRPSSAGAKPCAAASVEIAVVANSSKRILVMEILGPQATFFNRFDALWFRARNGA